MDIKRDSIVLDQKSCARKSAWQTPTLQIRPAKAAEGHVDHESYMGSYHENKAHAH